MSAEPKLRANSFDTGMAAEFFVLSQLFRLGLEAHLSYGSKKAVDIRIVHGPTRALSLDVKSVRAYSSLVVNNVRSAPGHYIVFVTYNNSFTDLRKMPEVFIVPSEEVNGITKSFKAERRVMKNALAPYKNRWELLREQSGSEAA